MKPEKIERDVVVTLHYRLTLDNGSLVEESEKDDPLLYLHGHDNIIVGLEEELEGMKIGEQKRINVEAKKAYGERDPEAIQVIPRNELPPEIKPEIGMLLELVDDDENYLDAEVVLVESDAITIDVNHPLAGKRLHFDVTIIDLREAEEEELAHGHAHGDGHQHH